MDVGARDHRAYVFDQFRLDPFRRSLTRDGVPIHLPARLFDTLLYLVRNADRLVERDELRQAVWPGRTIEDGNVAKAISSLRLSLKGRGETSNLINNVSGRGYRLAALVTFEQLSPPDAPGNGGPAGPVVPAQAAPPGFGAAARSWRRQLAACAIAAACAGLALWHFGPDGRPLQEASSVSPPANSLAILPFENDGPKQDSYFSDGFSDELISALGRVRSLRVAARSSSFRFKGRGQDLADIARQLNVGAVLEGSVQRAGGRVRVTARLIDAASGFELWSHSYDRDQGDLLSMQQDLAQALIGSLKIVLPNGEAAQLTMGGTDNPQAFDAYLAGMANQSAVIDDAADQRAIEAFSKAVALDPQYALAYAALARARANSAITHHAADEATNRTSMLLAIGTAEQAVGLAPKLGAAHAALGFVLKVSLADLSRADAELTRAVTLSPGDADILMDYAAFQVDLGHMAAGIAAAKQAAALDPLTPRTYRRLAVMLAHAGRFDEAEQALHHAALLQPPDPIADRVFLSVVQILRGDAAGALQSCAANHDFPALHCQALAYHAIGRQAEAQEALNRLHAMLGNEGAYIYARIYAQWGELGEALRWLQVAYAHRDSGLINMLIDPALAPLRGTPEYVRIDKALGFPH